MGKRGAAAAQPVRRFDLVAMPAGGGNGGLHDTQGAPACCRGPSVEPGASGADGTGNGRTDEPVSGMVQSRTVSNVGATVPSPRITGTPSTLPRWPSSRNTSIRRGRGAEAGGAGGGRTNDQVTGSRPIACSRTVGLRGRQTKHSPRESHHHGHHVSRRRSRQFLV
jgi:hypothetical protein